MIPDDINIRIHNRGDLNPDAQMSKNFKWWEWLCGCGECQDQPLHEQMMPLLEALRERCNGASININSGYRCPVHNKKVGGASRSQHMSGNAADINVKGYTPTEVAKIADDLGFTGIKIYSSWVHVDLRSGAPWYANLPWRS